MFAPNAGPICPGPASPIETSPFWEMRQEVPFRHVRFSFGRRRLIPTTTQYADANEAKQLTEDEASEAHVTIIIRDYLVPLFGFEVAVVVGS